MMNRDEGQMLPVRDLTDSVRIILTSISVFLILCLLSNAAFIRLVATRLMRNSSDYSLEFPCAPINK